MISLSFTIPAGFPARALAVICMVRVFMTGGPAFGDVPATDNQGGKKFRTGWQECTHQPREGHTVSECRDYFKSGQLRSLAHYRDGRLHGDKLTYYFDGTLRQEYHFVNGAPRGTYTNYYENGTLSYRFTAPDDTIVHGAEYFYPDGRLWRSARFVNRRHHGPLIVYDQTGQVVDRVGARGNVFYDAEGRPLQGEWRTAYTDDRPMLVHRFHNGRQHGDREIYLPDGTLYSRYHFENGQFQGRSFEYYLSGALRVIKYYEAHQLIYIEEFDPSGTKVYESGDGPPQVPDPGKKRGATAATPFRT